MFRPSYLCLLYVLALACPVHGQNWREAVRFALYSGDRTTMEMALDLLERERADNPAEPAWHFYKGRLLGSLAEGDPPWRAPGRARAAGRDLRTALEISPESFYFRYGLVQFFLRAPAWLGGGYQRAKAEVQAHPAGSEQLLLQVSLLVEQRKYEKALELLAAVSTEEVPFLVLDTRDKLLCSILAAAPGALAQQAHQLRREREDGQFVLDLARVRRELEAGRPRHALEMLESVPVEKIAEVDRRDLIARALREEDWLRAHALLLLAQEE